MRMDVYFDYACPYCVRGLAYLQELLPAHQNVIEVNFIPVEAHPRPESYGKHTDLCAQGMYEIIRQGIDPWAYHAAVFKIAVHDRADIENPRVLTDALAAKDGMPLYIRNTKKALKDKSPDPLFDAEAFQKTLEKRTFADKVDQNNRKAYEENHVWAVPAYVMADGRRLDAAEGVGVSFTDLEALIKGARS